MCHNLEIAGLDPKHGLEKQEGSRRIFEDLLFKKRTAEQNVSRGRQALESQYQYLSTSSKKIQKKKSNTKAKLKTRKNKMTGKVVWFDDGSFTG